MNTTDTPTFAALTVNGNITVTGTVDGVDVADHNARHIHGGVDAIDGDKLAIDWNPTNYTPTTDPSEVDNVDQLTAHLAGIDSTIGDSMAAPTAASYLTLGLHGD